LSVAELLHLFFFFALFDMNLIASFESQQIDSLAGRAGGRLYSSDGVRIESTRVARDVS
jgi:hypothetical protein